MRFPCLLLLLLTISGAAAPVGAADPAAAKESAPDPLAILQRECVSCHTEAKRKGGLIIDSRESLLKGGDTDAAVVPGKSGESYLIESLFPDAYSHMPPKGQLDPREIAALEKWVDEGAKWDAEHWASLNLPAKTKVVQGPLPDLYQPILAMALSPDRTLLAVGRGSVIDWYRITPGGDEKTETKLALAARSTGHQDAVQSLAFSADGKYLASGGFRSIHLWETAKPAKTVREIREPFLGRITALRFLPDGKKLLAADSLPSRLGRLHEITLDSGKALTFDSAHLDTIFSIALSVDGKRYATTSADKLITVRDASSHEIVMRLEGHTGYVLTAAFSPGGDRIASGGDDEEIKVWDVATGKKISSFASRRSGPLYALSWHVDPANSKKKAEEKDKEKAAAINTDLIVSVPESGKPSAFTDLKEHEGEQRSTGAKERAFDKVETPLFALAFDPKSLWSYAGGEDGKLYVWDEKGKLKSTLEAAPVPAPKPEKPAKPAPTQMTAAKPAPAKAADAKPTPKPAPAKTAATKPKPAPAKTADAKPAPKPEPAKPAATKPAPAKPDPAKTSAAKPVAKPAPAKAAADKPKPAPAKTADAKPAPKPAPAKTADAKPAPKPTPAKPAPEKPAATPTPAPNSL
ncbi:MAG: hypothetical protein GXX91_07620 [Verrucomicrobiaceae bacterium]|nr:hypothetical protein [Verrucomicrobiaceae bacterium]